MIYGLTEGPADHLASAAHGGVVAGMALLVAFVVLQSRLANPLLPLGLFRNRQFTAANVVTFAVYGALSGGLFLLPVELQRVCGFCPVEAGSSLLPITVMMLLLSARMGRLATRIGPRIPMAVGPIVAGTGIALFSRLQPQSTYWTGVLPPILVFGLGMSITVAPLTATALAAAPGPQRRHRIGGEQRHRPHRRLVGGRGVAGPGRADAGGVHDPARLSTGFHHAVLIAGAVCAFGGVLAALFIQSDRLNLESTPSGE